MSAPPVPTEPTYTATYDVGSVAALKAVSPVPGSRVRLQRGITFAGPITLNWRGTENAPITLTTYGDTAQPAIITGISANGIYNPATYVDALTLTGKYIVVDGGVIDGGKLGLWIKNSGRAAIMKAAGSHNIDVLRVEMSDVGAGAILYGDNARIVGCYIHDLLMIKATFGGTRDPPEQVPGEPNATAWDDDDYGANGVIVSGSNVEIAWNRIMRSIAPAIDYPYDGGAFEIFSASPPANMLQNIFIHDNWIEGGMGVLEGGATAGAGGSVKNLRMQGNVCINNFQLAIFHNGGGFEAEWFEVDVSYNTVVELNNVVDTSQSIVLASSVRSDAKGKDRLAGFLEPYGVHHNIIFLNSGLAVFKQYDTGYHRDNVFSLQNKDPSPNRAGYTHLYNNWQMTLGSGESYVQDPKFVSIPGRDFSLQASSAAIGKGHTAWKPVAVAGISFRPTDYRVQK
jgi:hypothetical protein